MSTIKTRIIACLLLSAFVLFACTPRKEPDQAQPTPTLLQMPAGPGAVWDVVIIGDSSLWNSADALAEKIKADKGVDVIIHDFTLGALSAGQVKEVLEPGTSKRYNLKDLPNALKEAEYVLMFVNPLDSQAPGKPIELDACFSGSQPGACDPDRFEQYTADMEFIWRKTIELRDGQPTILRGTDIYNPLVAMWQEHGVFDSCTGCWVNMSGAARLASANLDIPFLSRYDAFNGADHTEDPKVKGLISTDGEHPSEQAGEYTAELLSSMGYEPTIP